MVNLKGKGRWATLIALIVVIPLLVLFIALKFVHYEQQTTTKHISVAVVNQDKAVAYQGKHYNVGASVVHQLKNDHAVEWHFVTAAQAKAGLASGHYLMQVRLPKNFSKNVTTALQKKPKQSTIQVSLSDHNNFASHVITETVANKLRDQVVQNVQQAYDSQALAAIKQLSNGVDQAHDGTTALKNGSDQLDSGNQQLNDGLHQLQGKTGPLGTGVSQLYTGSGKVTDGLNTLQTKSETLGAGVHKLDAGASQLATGSVQLQNGIGKIVANNQALLGGASTLQGGAQQLLTGSRQLHNALVAAADQIDAQLSSGKPQLDQLNAGLTQLDQGVAQLAAGVNDPEMDTLNGNITKELTDAGTQAKAIQSSLVALNAQLFDTTSDASVASQLTSMQSLMDEIKKTLMSDPQIISAILKNHPSMLTTLNKLNTLSAGIKKSMTAGGESALAIKGSLTGLGDDLGKLQTNLTTLNTNITTLKKGVNTLADEKQGSPAVTAGVRQAISQLQTGLTEVETGLTKQGSTAETKGAIQGSGEIENGMSQILAGLQGSRTSQGFVPGLIAYTDGVTQANSGATQLSNGATTLANGTHTLNQSVPALKAGVGQLASGSGQVTNGLGTLNASVPALTTGVDQLTAGSDQVDAGGQKLGAGITKLNVKLGDGSKQVQGVNTNEANVDHFVSPISNQTAQDALNLPLGDVLAPIVLMMVSFIGALLTELGLNRYSRRFRNQSLLNRILAVGAILFVQAVALTAVAAATGINLYSPLATIVVLFAAEAVFATIIFAFDQWFGTIGVLVTLAILFLQMIVSGGLLPNDMLSGFYQGLAKLLPGTYVLDALNWALNGLQTTTPLDGIMLLVFAAIFGGSLYLRKRLHAPKVAA